MSQYFEKIVLGTEHEDMLVILQFLHDMIGERFTFLNYFKEIPISFDATLLSVENNMAEFSVHEYQAKVINMEKNALIYAHQHSPFEEDLVAEAFYVNPSKKRIVLCNFGYAKICSDLRRFVRVLLDSEVEAELLIEDDSIIGNVKDISIGGAAITTIAAENLIPGLDINMFLKLPDNNGNSILEVEMNATIIKVVKTGMRSTCVIEFHPEKHSQQQISYYINQRQVEIIKELKNMHS